MPTGKPHEELTLSAPHPFAPPHPVYPLSSEGLPGPPDPRASTGGVAFNTVPDLAWYMATSASDSTTSRSLVSLPSNSLGYLAALVALVTGVIHLLLGVRVLGFNQILGVLFLLNGLGFLGGLGLYVSRFWRPELYLVATAYALVTIVAFFGFQGLSVDAFYMQGSLNPFAVVSKLAELVLAVVAAYLYTASGGTPSDGR